MPLRAKGNRRGIWYVNTAKKHKNTTQISHDKQKWAKIRLDGKPRGGNPYVNLGSTQKKGKAEENMWAR